MFYLISAFTKCFFAGRSSLFPNPVETETASGPAAGWTHTAEESSMAGDRQRPSGAYKLQRVVLHESNWEGTIEIGTRGLFLKAARGVESGPFQ